MRVIYAWHISLGVQLVSHTQIIYQTLVQNVLYTLLLTFLFYNIRRISNVYTSPPAAHKKEWNSDVENEILRLYESSEPKSTLICDWALPQTGNGFDHSPGQMHRNCKHDYAFAVERSVESRLARAEQTPNYVLALANMFRKRLEVSRDISCDRSVNSSSAK